MRASKNHEATQVEPGESGVQWAESEEPEGTVSRWFHVWSKEGKCDPFFVEDIMEV